MTSGVRKQVGFDTNEVVHEIVPYSEMYEVHPHFLLSTSSGWKRMPPRADPFTGKSATVLKARRKAAKKRLSSRSAKKARQSILNAANQQAKDLEKIGETLVSAAPHLVTEDYQLDLVDSHDFVRSPFVHASDVVMGNEDDTEFTVVEL